MSGRPDAAPSAGSANGPTLNSTTLPETGSVASVPLPNPLNGVVAEDLVQSLPFHSQVAAFGKLTTPHPVGGTVTVPAKS